MRIAEFDYDNQGWAEGVEASMVRITGQHETVSITQRQDGAFAIQVDPSGQDFYSTLDVIEASLAPNQVRLRVRGQRVSEDRTLSFATVRVALQNLLFSMSRNASKQKADWISEAEAIVRTIDRLEEGE